MRKQYGYVVSFSLDSIYIQLDVARFSRLCPYMDIYGFSYPRNPVDFNKIPAIRRDFSQKSCYPQDLDKSAKRHCAQRVKDVNKHSFTKCYIYFHLLEAPVKSLLEKKFRTVNFYLLRK